MADDVKVDGTAHVFPIGPVNWSPEDGYFCNMCGVKLQAARWVASYVYTAKTRGRPGTLDMAEMTFQTSIDQQCCTQECAQALAAKWIVEGGPPMFRLDYGRR